MKKVRYFPRGGIVVAVVALALGGCVTPPPATSGDAVESASVAATPSVEATGATTPDAMAEESEVPVVVNDKLQFKATTVTGASFDGTSLAGADAILWFWASWCPTCQAEAPDVAAAAAQLPQGVTMYGVPGKSDQAGMEQFVNAYGLGDVEHIVDGDGSLWSTFGVPYQPAFALINDTGEITVIQGSLGQQGILDAAADLASN